MKMIKLTSILFLALISFQCASSKKSKSNEQEVSIKSEEAAAEQGATMRSKGFTKGVIVDKTGLDGCTFLIEISDSKILEPIQLDEKFRKNGLAVYFKYKRSRKATTCMNGQPIIISEIQLSK